MYINSQTGAVQEPVAIYKTSSCIPYLCALPGSARHRDPMPAVSGDRCTGPLCEVLIM
ncbi:unnamed protein product [Staurois parvus]|uniref:Uncharacterized protein n=1 Tax=Staurois parvus TaxID=386267 RepID=A0ABN9BNL4_9NEOB|nr:unnamed protein product [Staurois parvus]